MDLGHGRPQPRHHGRQLEEQAGEEPLEDEAGLGAPLLARDEDLGACRALGVGEPAVLLHDEIPAERDHHQDAEDSSAEREEEGPRPVHLESHEHEGGQGEGHAGGDRLPRRPRRLHDRVLEDRGPAAEHVRERAEEGDRDDRDRHGGRDGEADPQGEVHRGGPEDEAEQRAHRQGAQGQLGQAGLVGDEGLEGGAGGGRGALQGLGHVTSGGPGGSPGSNRERGSTPASEGRPAF